MNPRTHEDRKIIQLNVHEARRAMDEKRIQEEIAWAEYAVVRAMMGCSLPEIEHTQGCVRSLIRRGKTAEQALSLVGLSKPDGAA